MEGVEFRATDGVGVPDPEWGLVGGTVGSGAVVNEREREQEKQ